METKHILTEYEEKFINVNYPIHGINYILQNLDISEKCFKAYRHRMKLKITRDKININLNNKYLCYILGLIWADGTVSISDRNRVNVKMQSNDISDIEWIFDKLGKWNKDIYDTCIRVSKSDKTFKKFLIDNDYDKKSAVSPDKVLSIIPEDNVKYFIRGIFDGDGCFFFKRYDKDSISRVAFISSSYEQDWTYMINLCNKIGCKYYVRQVVNRKKEDHKSSCFKLSCGDIIRFGNYIYDDNFGLTRKYEKFNEIKESYTYKKCIKV